MRVLITGGAGFIGRWLTNRLLLEKNQVTVIDDFSNGRKENVAEFFTNTDFHFIQADIRNTVAIKELFQRNFDIVYHLAAEINVQKSIDDPKQTFDRDVVATFQILEECRKSQTKMVFMSTCMVYDRSISPRGIDETHPVKPASPYAASKLSGEAFVLSYFHSFHLPTIVIRPFNTYGPFQKTNGEGGVVAIFLKNHYKKLPLRIFGEGLQTRDLLYVEDCVDFIVKAGESEKAVGQIINAGTGNDISINDLATRVATAAEEILHVPHIHPQAEIMKLKCNAKKAKTLLGWQPKHTLQEGLAITADWILRNPDL